MTIAPATASTTARAPTEGVRYGRYLALKLVTPTAKSSLVLCEVRVWGRNCSEVLDRAQYKPVLYSGTVLDSSSIGYLVDGNVDTRFANAFDYGEAWALIDLIGTYFLDYVEVVTGESCRFAKKF